MNNAILIGRLTADPELRYTPNGVAVAKFTLAVDRPFTNGDGKREADFIPVVAWKKLAEATANHLKKGQKAAVQGRIQIRNYENNEGRRVYVTETVAENVEFLPPSQSSQANQHGAQTHDSGNSDSNGWVSDEDLPF